MEKLPDWGRDRYEAAIRMEGKRNELVDPSAHQTLDPRTAGGLSHSLLDERLFLAFFTSDDHFSAYVFRESGFRTIRMSSRIPSAIKP
jgi:hypothetical protein